MNKRKMVLLLFILFIILSMSGCVKLKSNLVINSDGSSDLSIIYAIDEKISALGGDLGFDDTRKEAETNGFKVTNYKDDDYIGLKVKKHFNTLEELSKQSKSEAIKLKVIEEKGFIKNKYTLNGAFDMTGMMGDTGDEFEQQMNESMLSQMDLSFTLTLPSKAGENNATKVKNEGKTLYWELVPNENNKLELVYEKYNYINLLMLLMGGIILIGTIIILTKKMNHKKVEVNF